MGVIRREPERRSDGYGMGLSRIEALEKQARDENYEHVERYERSHADHKAAEELARQIGEYVNHGGDIIMLAQEMSRHEHRTLQQKIMGLCLAFIADEALLGGCGVYDARNQATVAIAQHIMDSFGEDADIALHLPFI